MASYVCVKVDWTTSNKVNGSYTVYVDTIAPITDCSSSGGAGYILGFDQTSFDFIKQTYTGSSGSSVDLGTLDAGLVGEGFGYTLVFFFLGLTIGFISRLVSRMRSPR